MKIAVKLSQFFIIASALCFLAPPAHAVLLPSDSDLWEYTNFAGTPSSSGIHPVSDVRDMFGGEFSSVETGNTLFRDFVPAGTIHTVAWETLMDQTVRSIGFFAGHDGNGAVSRGISRFSLFGEDLDNGSLEALLFEIFPSDPYGATPGNNHDTFLWLDEDITTPIRATNYRAEFVQFGNGQFFPDGGPDSGPRVWELDAYSTFLDGTTGGPSPTVIPEPTTLFLLGSGLLGAYVMRRRR